MKQRRKSNKEEKTISKKEAEDIIQILEDSKWNDMNFTSTAVNNAFDMCINLIKSKL